MKKSFWPRAILLDFYGTVVEEDNIQTERICNEIAQASCQRATAEDIHALWSREFHSLFDHSFGDSFRFQKEIVLTSLESVLRYYEADLNSEVLCGPQFEYWAHPDIFPESKEVLAGCQVPVCLVSNIDNAELQLALEHHDLSFSWVLTSEDCRAYKPNSVIFEKALSLLGLSYEDVLHVGDSLGSDVQGAKSLGIPVLWVNRGEKPFEWYASPDDAVPDYISNDLTGLLDIIG
jgi:HAD superfamily hydrolase (TIGR01493 family)